MAEEDKIVTNRINSGETPIVTISHIRRYHWCGRISSFFNNIQPESLHNTTPSGRKAFRIDREEVLFDQFIQELPDIQSMLEEM